MMNTRILTAILMSVGIQVGNGFFIPVCLYFLDVVFARQVGSLGLEENGITLLHQVVSGHSEA